MGTTMTVHGPALDQCTTHMRDLLSLSLSLSLSLTDAIF